MKVRLRESKKYSNLGNSPSRTWQDLVDLVKYSRGGRLPWIIVNYNFILSLYLLSQWKIGSRVLQMCLITLYLIVLVVYRRQPQKKSY